jgi:glycosyltransferase involved in cell wall biosynthesis
MRKVAQMLGSLGDAMALVLPVMFAKKAPARVVSRENAKRLTIVQFGNYEEGFRRLESGGSENYYAQRYSVDYVGSLAKRPDIAAVTVICVSENSLPAVLSNGVKTSGIELYSRTGGTQKDLLISLVRDTNPTHLLVGTPYIPLIAWGVTEGLEVLPMFADSFRSNGIKARIQYRLLSILLNAKAINYVGNHNLAASLDLERIGVKAEKVIPYDWPALLSPGQFDPKCAPGTDRPIRLLYVGLLIESKGIGDVIRAVAIARKHGRDVTLSVVGRGEVDKFKVLAAEVAVAAHIVFEGPRTHVQVVEAMRTHDAVIVPSRWAYPEGLPMTLYEALCTRTPLLTSNHPMFALKIRDGYNALVFREHDPEDCAAAIERLLAAPDLYALLSMNAANAAKDYLCELKYDELISAFLEPRATDRILQCSLGVRYAQFLKLE